MTDHIFAGPSARLTPRTADVALVAVTGLGVGVLTSIGQTYLDGALNALVNSASAWLVAPFFVGARMRTGRGAAAGGLAVCALQLAGYYATAEARGFTAGSILVFWTVCAVVGGPVFGAAGRLWRTATGNLAGLGGAVLPAAFIAEAVWLYWHKLHYNDTAALWLTIGAVLALTLMRGFRELRWLVPAVALALVGEMVLTLAYTQSY